MNSKLIFKFAIALVVMLPASFTTSQGQTFEDVFKFRHYPQAGNPFFVSPAQGRDGRLYGTTLGGGTLGNGTVFRLTTEGVGGVLYSFDGTNGNSPYGGLILATDGNFYGTAAGGGSSGRGVLYRITPSGDYTVLHNFSGATDGTTPAAHPIEASDGNLYGTTNGDFSYPATVYKYSRTGEFTTLYQFSTNQFTAFPLLQAADGNLYGTTEAGGAYNCGIVFKMTTSGSLPHSYSFPCGLDGAFPYTQLVQAEDGNFYGTTLNGGSSTGLGCGTIFKMNQEGAVTILFRYPGTGPNCSGLEVGLVQATDGLLYGPTNVGLSGGPALFSITTSGEYNELYQFTSETGLAPLGVLAQHTSGLLYSTTYTGGYGYGTVYSLDMGLGPFVAFVRPTGKVAQTAQILGQGLTGSTSVTFNGVPATSFSVVSDTYMTAVVPTGATTGPVVVTTPSGPLTSNLSFRISQ
jgi:uncharacterized repeat protein (TIGR03803 family)